MTDDVTLEALLKSKPQYGYTSKAFEDGAVRMLRTTDITSAGSQGVDWDSVPFCDLQPKDAAKFQLHEDDLLVSRAGTVGVSHLVRSAPADPSVFASYLIRLVPDPRLVLPAYLYWFMQSPAYWAQITTMSAGVAQPNINATKLRELSVPVRELEEQHTIVEAIERMLSLVEAGRRDASRAGERVVPAERSLIEAALREAVGAPVKALGDLATTVRNGGHWRAPEHSPPGVPILRISAVRPGLLREQEVAYVTAEVTDEDRRRFSVKKGSLLFTRYSGNPRLVAACARVPARAAGLLHPDKLIRVDLGPSVTPEWVEIAAAGGATRTHLDLHVKTTSGQAGIAGRDVKTAPVPVPSLEQQQELVGRVHMGRERLRRLADVTAVAQEKAAALRRSILKAAFEGRLTGDAQVARSLDDIQEAIA